MNVLPVETKLGLGIRAQRVNDTSEDRPVMSKSMTGASATGPAEPQPRG